MTLSKMQDVAGCRAVTDNVAVAESFALSVYVEFNRKFGIDSTKLVKDYIANPKPDGYRSIHLVVRCTPPGLNEARKVEIQIRSLLQHRWATALETVDLFTGQGLKSGGGQVEWRRFFALAAESFAHQENRPTIPNIDMSLRDLHVEIARLAKRLHLVECLSQWRKLLREILEARPRDRYDVYCYLIELDVHALKTVLRSYSPAELKAAQEDYLKSEMNNSGNPHRTAVLVNAYSVSELEEAYPGYYGDTRAFLNALNLVQPRW